MELRKFRTAYNLELIPASHEGISLGDLVWDPIFGAPEFSRKGMPNTIYTAFLDAALIGADICTMRFDIMKMLYDHPLTDIGLELFLKDWEKVPK